MKASRYFAALILAFALTSLANAQTFYNNTGRQAFTASSGNMDEIADDTPFTGTQHVASFTFAYMNVNPGPVNATVRFYEVNPVTGLLGPLVATIPVENLLPGTGQFATINLTPAQQFDWKATPGIYHLQNVSGGFVSIQFTGALFQQGWYTAGGPSLDDFYDVTINQVENFSQDINASYYLQISSITMAPVLSNILINPSTVKGGQSATATVSITSPAPPGGLLLKLHSNKPRIAQIPATVLIPAGATSASVVITTIPVKRENVLVMSVKLNKAMEITNLFVTP
jgi:hypothetical protein